ncbi:2Fe-2S iron-sulfur cluster-binding protein [Sphingomonas profundi]|uniref:2Fe-2S iron-sulfur cluster-binding protein n=1 Tax=Alterirhizorhabdus profundi TaxID=2681549 RepID=UPI0012E7416B|nr:2Fe-2S iron-sulfur cluster-binding protein [Sphingomonas profundi]
MSGHRIAGRGRVDPARAIDFSFDDTPLRGLAGDTLASALLANGVRLVGRSFKYHRPRGLLGAGVEEPNALVGVDRGPGRYTANARATSIELHAGLKVESQNRWPSLGFDLGAANNVLSPLFPAGFYNKTFMWPRAAWEKVYEPAIRRMAGLGKAPDAIDPDRYMASHDFVDLLVVGGGRAGIGAALAASASGERVMILDEQAELGGKLLADPARWGWLEGAMGLLREGGVTCLPRTTAIGLYHDGFVGAVERLTDHLPPAEAAGPRERLHRIRAGRIILATGAIERPLVFADNDRPGIMLASAARTYLHRYGVAIGRRVALLAAHDDGYRAIFDLAEAGVAIAAIVDVRQTVKPQLAAQAQALGIELLAGHVVSGTRGGKALAGITVAAIGGKGERHIACDALLIAGGWTPTVHLWSHGKGKLGWDAALGAFVPEGAMEHVTCAGACSGAIDAGDGLHQEALWSPRDPASFKAFVDLQNDVTARDIRLAVREGFRSIEHIKRYTTNGMATDQGKTSNLNGLQIATAALGHPAPIGHTTFRPPYTPTTFGALAGIAKDALFQPTRRTVIDGWAEAHGAVFENVAQWRRARYFPQGREDMDAAVARECRAVRASVGLFDASTLGKIEVVGPDAAEFLNRMYTNPWKSLAPGRCRYGLLLGEDGFIRDDGVAARLADDRFHVTTTTGGAARVLGMMEDYLQTEWPDLNVWLTSTTEQYAVIAVQGPRAREVIAPLIEGVDLSPQALPHMAFASGTICGVPMRLFRVSFTGELGFEVNVPAGHGRMVWEAIHAAGQAYGITPYGTETMHVLRAEKGFIIVGQDTDGTITPDDAGMGWAVGKKKPDFVGKRSLARPDMALADRKQLVGLLTEDPRLVLEEGAQIVADPNLPVPVPMIGHVTSAYYSVTLGRSIALAVVAGGRARMGETLFVPMPGTTHRVTVTDMLFYDREGARLDG